MTPPPFVHQGRDVTLTQLRLALAARAGLRDIPEMQMTETRVTLWADGRRVTFRRKIIADGRSEVG